MNISKACFDSVLSISAGFGIVLSIPLRSSGPKPLWRLAARLRQSFGIRRLGIAMHTFGLKSKRGLKPSLISRCLPRGELLFRISNCSRQFRSPRIHSLLRGSGTTRPSELCIGTIPSRIFGRGASRQMPFRSSSRSSSRTSGTTATSWTPARTARSPP